MPRADLGIAVPPRWECRHDRSRGVLVAARSAHVPRSGLPPELTPRCVSVEGDIDLATWRTRALAELATELVDFDLEDDDDFDLFGHDVAYRRFAHRAGTADVLCDQWAWLVTDTRLGVTLTCSVAREDYPDYCDLFETIAETVEVGPQAA